MNLLQIGWQCLKAAETAAQDNPDLQFRIQVAQLPVMYTFIVRWNEMREAAKAASADWPMPPSARETFDQFLTIARRKNVTRLNEWQDGFAALEQAVQKTNSQE